MHVAFLGLGLIGGSVARALRLVEGWSAVAWTPSGSGPRSALAAGVIAAAPGTLEEAIRDADLVVLGAPPTACLALLEALAAARATLPAGAVITDVASTKAAIVERAAALSLRFVGGHPMAGRETAGFEAATANLFRDRPWVVVPGEADEEAVARVELLARAVGARPIRLDAGAHDRAVATISHLPLVAAAALAEAAAGGPGEPGPVGWPTAAALAAGGWRDATRLARGDAAMGAGIVATNAQAIAAALRAYRARLDAWAVLVEAAADDGSTSEEALRERFAAAKARLEDPS